VARPGIAEPLARQQEYYTIVSAVIACDLPWQPVVRERDGDPKEIEIGRQRARMMSPQQALDDTAEAGRAPFRQAGPRENFPGLPLRRFPACPGSRKCSILGSANRLRAKKIMLAALEPFDGWRRQKH
jgi:hypothetical protein